MLSSVLIGVGLVPLVADIPHRWSPNAQPKERFLSEELQRIRRSCRVGNFTLLLRQVGVGDAGCIRGQRRRSHMTCLKHRGLQGDKDSASRCDCVCDHEKNDRRSEHGDRDPLRT
jgi:hypothetical protein